jgi:hypothetical protein
MSGAGENMRVRSAALLIAVNLILTACVLEAALRLQQGIGPFYDLNLRPENVMVGLSDELNHVHLPGDEWDRDGLRRMNEPNAPSCRRKLLFMGDSFMEGLGTDDTVPVHVRHFLRQSFGTDVCVFNAACSSYSPSIYVVQARKLISRLRPNLVVIDIDETDPFDDYYRYRELVTRDDAGSIVAVRRTPITDLFQQGLVESTNKALYLHRLVAKLLFTRLEFPQSLTRYHQDVPSDLFVLARKPAAEVRSAYREQIAYFRATMEDLTRTLVSHSGSPDSSVYIHHPHLEHLAAGSGAFNDIVATTVASVASRYGAGFYDASADLQREFGADPRKYYIANDMHLNELGLRAYGLAVARYLVRMSGQDRSTSTAVHR